MNRLTGFFGGGKKSTNEDGMGPEKTDLAVGGENFGGGDFGGPGSMAASRPGRWLAVRGCGRLGPPAATNAKMEN